MADVDTSSYLKPTAPAQKSLMEQVKGFGDIAQQSQNFQRGAVGLDKDKLDLINQRYGYLLRELNSLPANATAEDLMKVGQQAVNMKLITPEMYSTFVTDIPKDPTKIGAYRQEIATKMATTQEAMNYHYGQINLRSDNQRLIPTVESPLFGIRQAGKPLQIQRSPESEYYDENNQKQHLGAQPPQAAPSDVTPWAQSPQAAQPPVQAQPAQSLSDQPTQNIPLPRPKPDGLKNMVAPIEQPAQSQQQSQTTNFNDRFSPSARNPTLKAEPDPLFAEGKAKLSKDQELSTQKLTAVKPLALAVKLIPDLRSGPGTDTYNRAIAALKANGVLSIDADKDPTAVYQMVNKYLNDYLSRRGGSTDAAREQLMHSSPDLSSQINPALLKLAQTAIAQDRIEAARGLSFGNIEKDDKGNITGISPRTDYKNYNRYAAGFPAGMDERAFYADLMTKKQKAELYNELQDMKKNNPKAYNRFITSLEMFEASKVGE